MRMGKIFWMQNKNVELDLFKMNHIGLEWVTSPGHHITRVLCDEQDQRKVIHAEGSVKKLVCIHKEDDVFD